MFFGATPLIFRNAKALRSRTTRAERALWVQLRKNRFHGFRFKRQHPITGYIADFYCHRAKLVIEIDGESHKSCIDYDKNRTEVMVELGLKVLRFSNEDVAQRIEIVLREIELELHRSTLPTAPSYSKGRHRTFCIECVEVLPLGSLRVRAERRRL